jgi:mannose-6-phosphate isomerase
VDSIGSRSSSVSSSGAAAPFKLRRKLVERPWGGELWFTASQELPLLIKFIYTHQALSFQVHPGDRYAAEHHDSLGKTEMWYIVSATPEARIALGFRESVTHKRLREAALSGEIEQLVNWVVPRPGDAYFTPAGTIHAIGGGIELWEIQQNSDITYRLFDYGRGRELHLDHAMNVTNTEGTDPGPVPLPLSCEYFYTERVGFAPLIEYQPDPDRFHVLIFVKGRGRIGAESFDAGEVWLVPAGCTSFTLKWDAPGELLRVAQV